MNNLPDGTYVELKAGCDEVYDFAFAGTRGTITAHDTDEYGFDKIHIEWDKEHWRYNGEPDGWTYPDHFQPVSTPEPPAEEIPKGPELVAPEEVPSAVDTMMRSQHVWEDPHMEGYIDSMTHGFDQASESDAFILVTMKMAHDPEMGPVIVYEMARGSALPGLSGIPGSDILAFISEQMRQKGQ